MNASGYYDLENSNFFLDPASTGTALAVAGTVDINSTKFLRRGNGKLLINHDGANAVIDSAASGGGSMY